MLVQEGNPGSLGVKMRLLLSAQAIGNTRVYDISVSAHTMIQFNFRMSAVSQDRNDFFLQRCLYLNTHCHKHNISHTKSLQNLFSTVCINWIYIVGLLFVIVCVPLNI